MQKKKEVGIITLHHANNYGAMFQVYALSKTIKSLGCSVFVVNYEIDHPSVVGYLLKPISFCRKMISKGVFSVEFIQSKLVRGKSEQKEAGFRSVFDDFRNRYLNIANTKANYNDLVTNCPEADVFITGSDQVWAADFLFSKPAYLLGFVPDTCKRVAYAPSFGKDRLEPYLVKSFKAELAKFDAISAREQSGVEIVKDLTGLSATQVLDPTLLLEDYSEIIDYSLVPDRPFAVVYRLKQGDGLADWMLDSAGKILEEENLFCVSVSTNCSHAISVESVELNPTPGQLLGLFEKSSLCITNSFHGTVFSIIFKRRFLCYARDEHADKQNVRMVSLLDSLGLVGSYCSPYCSNESISEKLSYEQDYETAHELLSRRKEASMKYLTEALG